MLTDHSQPVPSFKMNWTVALDLLWFERFNWFLLYINPLSWLTLIGQTKISTISITINVLHCIKLLLMVLLALKILNIRCEQPDQPTNLLCWFQWLLRWYLLLLIVYSVWTDSMLNIYPLIMIWHEQSQ